jgi:lipoate-protein ligase B
MLGSRLNILRPGLLSYDRAYQLQQVIAADVRAGADPTLILLEHTPTYTLGTRAAASNIITSEESLAASGARVLRTDRGGDVTFHGPGQIVGYPILDLRALHIGVTDYVCGLEQALIDALSRFGFAAERSPLNRGVWVDGAKIAAIGVRVSSGITTHGFALNVNTDLSWFDHIVPCGLSDVRVTSMQHVTGTTFDLNEVEDQLVDAFAQRFDMSAAVHEFAEAVV